MAGGGGQGGMFSSDPNVLSLLDGEQEKVTANRADLEESILIESSSSSRQRGGDICRDEMRFHPVDARQVVQRLRGVSDAKRRNGEEGMEGW